MKAHFLIATLFLLPFSIFAQQMKDITSQFGNFQLGKELVASVNSGSKEGFAALEYSTKELVVRNTSSGISDTQGNINYDIAWLNLNMKTPYEISFMLTNKKTKPYTYAQECVYWGIAVESFRSDGSEVRDIILWHADKYESFSNGKYTRYSISTNGGSWNKWYIVEDRKSALGFDDSSDDFKVKVKLVNSKFTINIDDCDPEGLTYDDWTQMIGHHIVREAGLVSETDIQPIYPNIDPKVNLVQRSNITGIKNIQILVGGSAEVAVKYFALLSSSAGTQSNSASNSGTDQKSASAYFEQGYKFAENGEFEKSKNCFIEVVRAKPDDYAAWYNLGFSYANLHQINSAVDCFNKVIELQPKDAEAHYLLGLCYDQMEGKTKDAINCYFETIKLEPENRNFSHAYYRIGYELFDFGVFCLNKGDEADGKQAINDSFEFLTRAEDLGNKDAKELLREIRNSGSNSGTSQKRSAKPSQSSQGSGLKKDPNFKVK